jgi:hypothetical protein
LAVATDTELEIANLLESKYDFKILEHSHDNRYDLLAERPDGKKYSFEIKADFTHARTGNIGVEFECRGKASSIAVSKADFYIYKIHNYDGTAGIYLLKTETLKKMISDKKYFRIVNGGDTGSNSMNYLLKDFIFAQSARKIG